jgi:hypothetical protein
MNGHDDYRTSHSLLIEEWWDKHRYGTRYSTLNSATLLFALTLQLLVQAEGKARGEVGEAAVGALWCRRKTWVRSV